MTKKRIKAPTIKSRIEFDVTIDELARATVKLREAQAKRDEQIQSIRDMYAPACNVFAEQVQGLALAAEKYAEEHRDELFVGKVKSAETALAVFGFRLGQPTLKTLSKAWTWERVLEALIERGLKRFVRTKQEPDKEALKQHMSAEELAGVGCRIDQTETFFIEPKDRATEDAA